MWEWIYKQTTTLWYKPIRYFFLAAHVIYASNKKARDQTREHEKAVYKNTADKISPVSISSNAGRKQHGIGLVESTKLT